MDTCSSYFMSLLPKCLIGPVTFIVKDLYTLIEQSKYCITAVNNLFVPCQLIKPSYTTGKHTYILINTRRKLGLQCTTKVCKYRIYCSTTLLKHSNLECCPFRLSFCTPHYTTRVDHYHLSALTVLP